MKEEEKRARAVRAAWAALGQLHRGSYVFDRVFDQLVATKRCLRVAAVVKGRGSGIPGTCLSRTLRLLIPMSELLLCEGRINFHLHYFRR